MSFPKNIGALKKRFKAEEDCLKYIIEMRWPESFVCPRCGSRRSHRLSTRRVIQCAQCRTQVSLTVGTTMDHTHISLRKWFLAAFMMTKREAGMSALELQRQLRLKRYEPAFYMLHKLREGMH